MGRENDALLSYLADNGRFADLFNQFYFGGKQIVKEQELEEASEIYYGRPGETGGTRMRDIKKRLRSGKELKILAAEAQSEVNYIMPWRVMDYDCREYGRQIAEIRRRNRDAENAGRKDVYKNAGERLCEVRKEDRIAPVYTLCLYHGTESWDGPVSLKDMMDFGDGTPEEGRVEWEKHFTDYPMRLVNVNELADCSGFRTALGSLLALLPYRRDKKQLKRLLTENPCYQSLDEETAHVASVLMGIKNLKKNRKGIRSERSTICVWQYRK